LFSKSMFWWIEKSMTRSMPDEPRSTSEIETEFVNDVFAHRYSCQVRWMKERSNCVSGSDWSTALKTYCNWRSVTDFSPSLQSFEVPARCGRQLASQGLETLALSVVHWKGMTFDRSDLEISSLGCRWMTFEPFESRWFAEWKSAAFMSLPEKQNPTSKFTTQTLLSQRTDLQSAQSSMSIVLNPNFQFECHWSVKCESAEFGKWDGWICVSLAWIITSASSWSPFAWVNPELSLE
jgi:hypothetical protein